MADPEDMGSRNRNVPKLHQKIFQKATRDRVLVPELAVASSGDAAYESAEKQLNHRSSFESKSPGSHKMKFQRHNPASTHVKKSKEKRDEAISTASMDQVQRMKKSKGNKELNDELKQKADELEKLFAEHKSNATRGNKSIKTEEQESDLAPKQASTSIKMVPELLEIQYSNGISRQESFGLGYSDQSRGKLYDLYTQKRDAKLKEEWSLKRAEKEARMKVLQDSLERSTSEMKSKLAGLNDSQEPLRRAEKLQSFTFRTEPILSFMSDEDEDQAEFVQVSSPVSGTPGSHFVKASASGAGRQKLHLDMGFQHEISDFDASVDSPIGSPARMREKLGVTPDSSRSQSRKDVKKGLKRFLKFGRKNRGADSLVDWVSTTTSEGDDDTEDVRVLASSKSLEDVRKSRLGFLHYHNDAAFSKTDSFGEQVHGFPSSSPTPPMNFKSREDHLSGSALKAPKSPKSFFSISTFRSKGSDSKPR